MGDVRGKPALAVLRGNKLGDLRLERVGHFVERGCPGAELIRRTGRQPGLEAPAGHQPGGLARPGDGLKRPSDERVSDQRRKQYYAEPGSSEGVAQLAQVALHGRLI